MQGWRFHNVSQDLLDWFCISPSLLLSYSPTLLCCLVLGDIYLNICWCVCVSVQTNIYFGLNWISNIIHITKLTKSNNEYYLCCEIFSNNIQIVQDIWRFKYFRIICHAKMKDFLNYQIKKLFFENTQFIKLNYHSYSFLLKKYLFKLKMQITLL